MSDDVWALFRVALEAHGDVAVSIEWEDAIPALARLLEESTRAARDPDATRAHRRDPCVILVWRRPNHAVHHRRVASDEAEWLAALDRDLDFAALCARLGRDRSDEEAARRALALVGSWAADGLLVGDERAITERWLPSKSYSPS